MSTSSWCARLSVVVLLLAVVELPSRLPATSVVATAHGGHHGEPGPGTELPPIPPLGPTPCAGGFSGPFPCARIDLESFVPLSLIGGGHANDIWGWTDPVTGREYALVGRTTGTSFVDVTNPGAPVYLGNLPTHTTASTWRGIKVYANHAFVVSEATGHGLQVFDLTELRGVTGPVTFSETSHYPGFSNSHTLAINEESGFAYAVGTNTCAGGLHMVDVRNPLAPAFAGCFSADGYTHETQCVIYRGVDAGYVGREICFSSNVDTLTIVDVTNKSAPIMLSRKKYPGRGFTHQGWLSEDHRYFLLDDERDEKRFKTNTRTHVWSVAALTAPSVIGIYEGASTAVDHNLYIRGSHAFEANYRSGLRVLALDGIGTARLHEIGFFDVHPEDDAPIYSGAWSNFPFFPSGIVVVSNIERGLFVLRPRLDPIAGADLIVSALSAPPMGGAGVPLHVTHTIENQGGSAAPPSVIQFFLSSDAVKGSGDRLVGTRDTPALSAGGEDTAALTVTLPPGTTSGSYYLLSVADATLQAAEEIENNNVRPQFIRVGADLTVSALKMPSTVAAGSAVSVTDTIVNAGGAPSESAAARLFLSVNGKIDAGDIDLGIHPVPPLAPSERKTTTTSVFIPPGTARGLYNLIVFVDRDDVVSEFDEANNTLKKKITVQ